MIIVCLFTLFTQYSCTHYFESKLKIINNSKEDVFFDIVFRKKIELLDSINSIGDTIKINNSKRPLEREFWEKIILRNSKDSILSVFFVKKSVLKKMPWKEIIQQKQYKIQTYRIKDLENLNWVVIYK